MSKVKDPDPRSLAAIDIAERFGNGEDFSQEVLKKTCDDAYTAANAAYASYATGAAYSATAAYSAASATYAATNAAASDDYKPLLLDLINKRLTKAERVLIFGEHA